MTTVKQACVTIRPWLKANLGPSALAPLTGQDSRALSVAVQALSLYSSCDYRAEVRALSAFHSAVMCMQESTRVLAYHSIAHLLNWSDRPIIWERAGLARLENVGRCKFE